MNNDSADECQKGEGDALRVRGHSRRALQHTIAQASKKLLGAQLAQLGQLRLLL